MAQIKPIYPIVIDDPDNPRPLRWDVNAYAAFEAAIGKKIAELDGAYFGFLEIRGLVYSGLLHIIRKITIDQAGELMDEIPLENRQEVFNKIVKSFYKSLGVDVDAQATSTEGDESKNSPADPGTMPDPGSDSRLSSVTGSDTEPA